MATLKMQPSGGCFISGLVVEKTDIDLAFAEVIPVALNHRSDGVIGKAMLSKQDGVLVADVDLYRTAWIGNLYPSIGFRETKQTFNTKTERAIEEGRIFGLGLCEAPNVDTSIESIGKQLTEIKI